VANELQGKKIAILLAPVGTEQVEFEEAKKAVEDAGGTVDVVGLQTGEAQTMNSDVNPGDTFTVEKTFSDVSADEYDGLVVPGGTVGADKLRGSDEAVNFVHSFLLRAGQAGRSDLPRSVDARRSRRGEGTYPDLVPHPADRYP
jgi:protease I